MNDRRFYIVGVLAHAPFSIARQLSVAEKQRNVRLGGPGAAIYCVTKRLTEFREPSRVRKPQPEKKQNDVRNTTERKRSEARFRWLVDSNA